MFTGRFKLRWMMLATVALTFSAATTTSCSVRGSDSSSSSGSADDWSAGDESTSGSLDEEGNGHGHGCTEEALWCPSLGIGLSRDPNNNCEFPPCPSVGYQWRNP
ncbi:hypothetical protein GN244_ATG19078 [Phytophthora infestans]|uniref:Secreted protein n=1 Tax=Phytophthora infestans TaxID=4787 RepID=A0A833W5D3_PHYIN|nr:hypothetical protein GN244_ATG19078 [Phytophthora infestans]KAF4129288.1 hypothetical protein GN958_ATG21552 [Phytophthora infestans]